MPSHVRSKADVVEPSNHGKIKLVGLAEAATSGRRGPTSAVVAAFGGTMISLRPPRVLNSIGTWMSTVWPSMPGTTRPAALSAGPVPASLATSEFNPCSRRRMSRLSGQTIRHSRLGRGTLDAGVQFGHIT